MMPRHQLILIVLVAGLFAGWTPTQKAMWGTYTLAWAIDLGQTRYIAKNPDIYHEDISQFAIGKHPSTGTVNNYFIAQYLLNYFIVNNLSGGWRTAYMSFSIVEHSLCIKNNKAIGIKIDYKF